MTSQSRVTCQQWWIIGVQIMVRLRISKSQCHLIRETWITAKWSICKETSPALFLHRENSMVLRIQTRITSEDILVMQVHFRTRTNLPWMVQAFNSWTRTQCSPQFTRWWATNNHCFFLRRFQITSQWWHLPSENHTTTPVRKTSWPSFPTFRELLTQIKSGTPATSASAPPATRRTPS